MFLQGMSNQTKLKFYVIITNFRFLINFISGRILLWLEMTKYVCCIISIIFFPSSSLLSSGFPIIFNQSDALLRSTGQKYFHVLSKKFATPNLQELVVIKSTTCITLRTTWKDSWASTWVGCRPKSFRISPKVLFIFMITWFFKFPPEGFNHVGFRICVEGHLMRRQISKYISYMPFTILFCFFLQVGKE